MLKGDTSGVWRQILWGVAILIIIVTTALSAGRLVYAGKILPGVTVGVVDLGGLTREVAEEKLRARIEVLKEESLKIKIDKTNESIHLENFGISYNLPQVIDAAWQVGRQGSWTERAFSYLRSLVSSTVVLAPVVVDEQLLRSEIESLATLYDIPGRDVRLSISKDKVDILFDTNPGLEFNREALEQQLLKSAGNLDALVIFAERQEILPHIKPESAPKAKLDAENIISEPLTLVYGHRRFVVSPSDIGAWIISGSESNELQAIIDERNIGDYVITLAEQINTTPQNSQIKVENGKVVDFVPPRSGKVLEENETVQLIKTALEDRRLGQEKVSELSLPVVVREPVAEGSAAELGIVELIGSATTPFTGSPKNRVLNIKNGTKFLTGILIAPGEEFSTVQSLGTIDNTTGYLPELVIKGDRTVPEFGGGLCQVSTTLFRAVLNAGLPITARRNHSYRVSYYERDAEGNYIGPGLDATIYSPNPDFRFRNDTGATILVSGYVEGDLLTFNLYGTKDGRVSEIDGPYTLTTIEPGEPIYVETDELAPGEKKRLETAHPGGAAEATYKVTYSNGEVVEQKFESYYRPWPERWLVGIDSSQQKKDFPGTLDTEI